MGPPLPSRGRAFPQGLGQEWLLRTSQCRRISGAGVLASAWPAPAEDAPRGGGNAQVPTPASRLLLPASSEGGRYTDLRGHAKAIQGRARDGKTLAYHTDGHQNGYRGAGSRLRPQVAQSERSICRVWGCQAWHSMRQLGLGRNGSRGSLANRRQTHQAPLVVCGRRGNRSSRGPAGGMVTAPHGMKQPLGCTPRSEDPQL